MNNSNDKVPNGENTTGFPFQDQIQDAWNPNDGQFFKGKAPEDTEILESSKNNPRSRKSQITKVDGVEAYSQYASLYPGYGQLQQFSPQPGLDKSTGKMPPGKTIYEPQRPYVERNKMGFESHPQAKFPRIPKISPYPSNKEDSTTYDFAVHTTVRDLKYALGQGMGARTNKYILELDIPSGGPSLEKLNILCQATSFPQRNMTPATVWRMGRKYNLRGEVDYGGSWTLTFVDDSTMSVRRALDSWHIFTDDSKIQDTALQGLYDSIAQKLSGSKDLRRMRTRFGNYKGGKEYHPAIPSYQTDIKVFQLDQVGNRIMGYLIQNAFITEISQIDYGDDQENQLTKFSVTITFSEFLPLVGSGMFFDIKKH